MSPFTQLRRFGADAMMLAQWTALTRWLIDEGAPLEVTVAAGEMAAGSRRRLRGQPSRLHRNKACSRIRRVAFDALAAWKSCGDPGLGAAVRLTLRQLQTTRPTAHN